MCRDTVLDKDVSVFPITEPAWLRSIFRFFSDDKIKRHIIQKIAALRGKFPQIIRPVREFDVRFRLAAFIDLDDIEQGVRVKLSDQLCALVLRAVPGQGFRVVQSEDRAGRRLIGPGAVSGLKDFRQFQLDGKEIVLQIQSLPNQRGKLILIFQFCFIRGFIGHIAAWRLAFTYDVAAERKQL